MFRRHAGSVILLGGWLLMLPPVEKGAAGPGGIEDSRGNVYRVLTEAPLTRWVQEAAYDTARECERAKEANTHEHAGAQGVKHTAKSLGEEAAVRLTVSKLTSSRPDFTGAALAMDALPRRRRPAAAGARAGRRAGEAAQSPRCGAASE